jgi:hypothetical protein
VEVTDDLDRARHILRDSSDLLGPGRVLLQIWSSPVVEWVFVGAEEESVVVSDNGETFAWISGRRTPGDHYLPWSIERATTAATRFGVEVLDEGGEGYEAFRLARTVRPRESVAEVVQTVALAIDGTLALHTRPGSATYDSYFWQREPEDEAPN